MKKPKAPTVATLQAQLDGAHARIRDLEMRERITTAEVERLEKENMRLRDELGHMRHRMQLIGGVS